MSFLFFFSGDLGVLIEKEEDPSDAAVCGDGCARIAATPWQARQECEHFVYCVLGSSWSIAERGYTCVTFV